jgi:hypothetical protein
VFNDAGADVDFRVEGDTDANLLFVDAGNDRVGIGTNSPGTKLHVETNSTTVPTGIRVVGGSADTSTTGQDGGATIQLKNLNTGNNTYNLIISQDAGDNATSGIVFQNNSDANNEGTIAFITRPSGGSMTERARITSGGILGVGVTNPTGSTSDANGVQLVPVGAIVANRSAGSLFVANRNDNDGELIVFAQGAIVEGAISVSGNTITYGAFCGGHWTQLKEGRGYNPDIPRGTVMSSIGEMAVWKSVEWTETIEHPAIEAVEAVEAVLDEDGNVIEPAVEAVEGKDAWTETFNKREPYLGNLDIGATFEEDGFTKTVIDDGNERLPKVKISDVVGDKAVYGVFQTWDDVEDMLVSSLGAFVVRIASGVTVEVGDLLESNGDGCAKVQDDDIIRSKTIGKVTSTVATDTYDDGSYTVPCVLYCG